MQRMIGPVLFATYLVAYSAFVGIAAFGTFRNGAAAGGLATIVFHGLSAAIVAGFALIVGAFVLALLYAVSAVESGDAPPNSTHEGIGSQSANSSALHPPPQQQSTHHGREHARKAKANDL